MKKTTLLTAVFVLIVAVVLVSCGESFRFEGTVRNGISNQPMEGVTVIFNDKTETTTDADGMFAFEGIKKGENKIVFESTGFETMENTFVLEEDLFEEILLYPVMSDSTNDENIPDENSNASGSGLKDIPTPIPPGEKLENVPGFEIITKLDNCKVVIGIGPESRSVVDMSHIYMCDGIMKIEHKDPTGGSMTDIITEKDIYSFNPATNEWYKIEMPDMDGIDEMSLPTDIVVLDFKIINDILSQEGTEVSKLDPIKVDDIQYERYFVSGVGSDVKHSMNGEIYVLNNKIMGFDGRIANGQFGSVEQNQTYFVVSDIGNIQPVQIPENVVDMEFPGGEEVMPMPEPEPIEMPGDSNRDN